MKLILESIKSLFRKIENKIPNKVSDLENDVFYAKENLLVSLTIDDFEPYHREYDDGYVEFIGLRFKGELPTEWSENHSFGFVAQYDDEYYTHNVSSFDKEGANTYSDSRYTESGYCWEDEQIGRWYYCDECWMEIAYGCDLEADEPIVKNEYQILLFGAEVDDDGNVFYDGAKSVMLYAVDTKTIPSNMLDLSNIEDGVDEAINIAHDVGNQLGSKMDSYDPWGSGSFSMNRKSGTTIGDYSHAEGLTNTASGYGSHAEGYNTIASGNHSHAEGSFTEAAGSYSHAEGFSTTASGDYSHAEGYGNTALNTYSHAEGSLTTASGVCSHAEGYGNTASGKYSHAEGYYVSASGQNSHAEGYHTSASNYYAHAEGYYTVASASISHAEGSYTEALSSYAHAEGNRTKAVDMGSHTEGDNTIADSKYQHVQGKYNIVDSSDIYAHIVGNGTSDTARSNAHTIDWSGNAWFAGDVYVGGTGQDDTSAERLARLSDIPEGGSPEWKLLHDGSVTIEEPVKNIIIPLSESCEGMTEFYGSASWTDNTNTETGNDSLAIFIGKFGISYGRFGDATKAASVIFGGEALADRTNWWKIQENNSMMYNSSTPQCGYTPSNANSNLDYNNVSIRPFSIAYSGTFTLKIYGR
jgi:hypothetical protein